jgi:4-hydroxy-3-methylbut-2-enyl diphosphate reductase IspH
MIPKFREVLILDDLEHDRCRDALKTLNELVHQPEITDKMIDHDLLQISANLLKHPFEEVREQAAILLSSFALSKRAREIFGYAFAML